MKILVFGAGDFYHRYRYWLEKMDILAILDNDKKKHGMLLDGHVICSPSEGMVLPFERVYVLGKYRKEMRQELLSLGVDSTKIHDELDLENDLKNEIAASEPSFILDGSDNKRDISWLNHKAKDSIVFISQGLSFSGAHLALLAVAELVKDMGEKVIFVSPEDGPLHAEVIKSGMNLVIEPRLLFPNLSRIKWAEHARMIWLNTVQMQYILINRNKEIPVFWWIHEPEMMYIAETIKPFYIVDAEQIDFSNVYIYCVSEIAKKYFLKYYTGHILKHPEIFTLGVKDIFDGEQIKRKDGIAQFAVIGAVEKIKGHDILLDAVYALDKNIGERCRFYLIGDYGNNIWTRNICQRAEQLENVELCGQYDRIQISTMLKNVDAVIVPSRAETLSIVAVEGMMFHKGVICSDETVVGAAQYVRDGHAGILVRPESVDDLVEAITWVVTHRDEWNEIGENGRRVYEDCFSIDSLNERVQHILSNVLAS